MVTLEKIYAGETARLEFKREPPTESKKWVKTVVAFANGRGGTIVFGVDDKTQRVVGVDPDRAPVLADAVANAVAESVAPRPSVFIGMQTLEGKTLVVVDVAAGSAAPYHLAGSDVPDGVFVRLGATTRAADREEVRELLLDGENKTYDEIFERGAEPAAREEIDALCETIRSHAAAGGAARQVGVAQLVGWGLLRRDGEALLPSVAFRLFARGDLRFSRTQCALFKGAQKVDFLRRLELEGTLVEQLQGALAFVEQALPPGARIRGARREDVYEIPMEAVRELVCNALMHRSYLSPGFVQVAVYADRFEVTSPGTLCRGVSREDMLCGVSHLRNRIVADLFRKMGFVEGWGSGLRRVFDSCREAGLPPPRVEILDSAVRVSVMRPSLTVFEERVHGSGKAPPHRDWHAEAAASAAAAGAAEGPLVAREPPPRFGYRAGPGPSVRKQTLSRVLSFVRASPGSTRLAAAAALGLSARTVTRALSVLMADGLVEHRGNDKFGGFYPIGSNTHVAFSSR